MWGAVGIVVLGLVIAFIIWNRGEKEVTASEELSNVTVPVLLSGGRSEASGAYLKVANEYPQSSAGARALLLAAANYFVEGKYDDAKKQFEKFKSVHHESPFLPEALLGIAACLDAEGKANDAATAYNELIERHKSSSVVAQAEFALANIYEMQNKPEQAKPLFEDVIKRAGAYGSLGSEAGMRLEELQMKYPKLAAMTPAPLVPPTNSLPLKIEQ